MCSVIFTVSTSPGMGFKWKEKFLLWKIKCTADLQLNHIGESNYNKNGMASCVYSMGKGKKEPTLYMKCDTKETAVTKQYP